MKNIYNLFLLLIIIGAVTSCGPDKKAESRKIFRYNESSGLNSLDPAFAKDQAVIWATNQLFNGLVQIDNELNIMPCIAKSWEISDNGLTYTFILRNDVYFHDHELFPDGKGRKVTASDFLYSFKRVIDPQTASPGAWVFNDRINTDTPFVVVDDHTFQINLAAPFRPMLGVLTMQYCSVVPKEVVEYFGKDFRKNPIGTGPFKFNLWEEGIVLTMVKNNNYFEEENGQKLPYVDGIKVSFSENKHTAFLNFMNGDLDFFSGLDPSYKDDVLNKKGNLKDEYKSKINLYKTPYLNTEYLGIMVNEPNANEKNNPLLNKQIRKAINYGFDREEMIEYLRNNVGTPAKAGFIPKGLPSYNADKIKGYEYDPEKSRKLLSDAGYPGGEGLPKIILYTNPSYVDFCTYIQRQLSEVGINIELETIQPGLLRDLMARSEARFFRGSWIADYPDAESYLSMFYSKNPAPPNYMRFNNEAFDRLYERSLNENNDEKRYELYQEMDSLIIEEAPVVPLFYDEVVRFIHKGVEGLDGNPINLLIIKKVKLPD